MKAAVIQSPGVVEVTSVADPAPGARDVVVQVEACGICGTDLHILEGEFAPALPVVPGHEFAGTIVALGSDVFELAVGDRVAVDPSLYCGECHYCRIGRGNLCERWNAIGVTRSGGAAEFVAAPAANCVQLPEHVATADAALIEPLSCALRGMDALPRRMADHYLIYGAGTMGLMMLELVKRAGAASVDVVDLNPGRLETARALGCSNAVVSADELSAARGWEVVIDCTGAVAAIEDGTSAHTAPALPRGPDLRCDASTPPALRRGPRPYTLADPHAAMNPGVVGRQSLGAREGGPQPWNHLHASPVIGPQN